MQKIPTKNLPDFLKKALKDRKFTKREISVDIKDVAHVYPNEHASQYDNFDYSYSDLANLKNRSVQIDLQKGVKSDHKEVHLADDDVLISGDRINNYASLTMSEKTFNNHFSEDLKTVNKMLKGAVLELLNLKQAKVSLEQGVTGLLIRDLESKIGEKAIPHHKEGKKQLAAANKVVDENKDKIANMKFREALQFISEEVQKKTGKYFSWNSWDSWM